MEKPKNNLIEFLKNQIVIENEIVASLEKALVDMKNPAVKGVLKGVSLDSVKHAELYIVSRYPADWYSYSINAGAS